MSQADLNKAAQKAAAKRISDLLTSPQHLTSVDQLKESTIKKKLALEVNVNYKTSFTIKAQIKSVVQTQLEDARQSYTLLDESNNFIGSVRDEYVLIPKRLIRISMKQIDSLCGDSQKLIPDKVFGIIRKVLHILLFI